MHEPLDSLQHPRPCAASVQLHQPPASLSSKRARSRRAPFQFCGVNGGNPLLGTLDSSCRGDLRARACHARQDITAPADAGAPPRAFESNGTARGARAPAGDLGEDGRRRNRVLDDRCVSSFVPHLRPSSFDNTLFSPSTRPGVAATATASSSPRAMSGCAHSQVKFAGFSTRRRLAHRLPLPRPPRR